MSVAKSKSAEADITSRRNTSHERQATANPSKRATVWYGESRDRISQGMRPMATPRASSAESLQYLKSHTDLIVTS
jgi:hypothetical protein